MFHLVAIGCLGMLAQVVLLRELAVASFGVEPIYLLGVGLWLLAGAAGALAGRRRGVAPPGNAAPAFLALAAVLLPCIAFLRGARQLFLGVPGAYLPLSAQGAIAVAGLAPAAFLLGLLFRRAARAAVLEGASPATAYGFECAGGVLGSVLSALAPALGFPNLPLGAGVAVASAAIAARTPATRRPAVALLAALLAFTVFSAPLDRWMTGWSHPGLSVTRDTPYGRVTVERDRGMLSLFVNDAFDYESEGADAEPFAHLPALQLPPGARVLLLGGAASGLVPELLKHAPARVDCVERDRLLHEALVGSLPTGLSGAFRDPAVRVVFADPRRFLADGGVYDLILVAISEPASGAGNRFFTVEFFRLCAAHLSGNGVLALRLPSSETVWTPQLARRNGSVRAALGAAFPDILAIPGASDILIASRGRLLCDPAELAARFRERAIAARVVTPQSLAYLLRPDRAARVETLLREAGAEPNSDARPIGYQQTVLLWLGMFFPAGGLSPAVLRGVAGVSAASGAAWLAAARLFPALRRPTIAAAGSFCAMIVESAVLLRFQAESGALYGQIGLLLTGFMGGLSAGAFAFGRFASGREVGRGTGAALLGSLGLLALLVASAGGRAFGPAGSTAMLAAAGALSGALFGYAGRAPLEGRGAGVAGIYAADLVGGCVGSLLAGVLLIPLFGAGPVLAGAVLAALAACAAL